MENKVLSIINFQFLQHYWWAIISLLGALLVFLLFVQGGQTLIRSLGKTEKEQSLLINLLGRKWGITFTTLVTFGGAFFASFPLFYSTSFGGAYWVWMIILFSFVIQAVSYEFRTKPRNLLGQKTYDTFLYINGLLGPLLLGVVVATMFTGAEFTVIKSNITNISGGSLTISEWKGAAYGLEALLNPTNVALGLAVYFLSRILGALYFIRNVDSAEIVNRSRKIIKWAIIPFLLFFLYFVVVLFLKTGFAVNPETEQVFLQPYKYFNNFVEMPMVAVLFLAGVAGVLLGIWFGAFTRKESGFWFAAAGVVLAVFSLLLIAGYNGTSYYPSMTDLQSSLTLKNSSSGEFTLKVMSVVSLMVPFVLAYIVYAWRKMNKTKISEGELEGEEHNY
jgi:cytochrome d ubiquinol oxidase subunit II